MLKSIFFDDSSVPIIEIPRKVLNYIMKYLMNPLINFFYLIYRKVFLKLLIIVLRLFMQRKLQIISWVELEILFKLMRKCLSYM